MVARNYHQLLHNKIIHIYDGETMCRHIFKFLTARTWVVKHLNSRRPDYVSSHL